MPEQLPTLRGTWGCGRAVAPIFCQCAYPERVPDLTAYRDHRFIFNIIMVVEGQSATTRAILTSWDAVFLSVDGFPGFTSGRAVVRGPVILPKNLVPVALPPCSASTPTSRIKSRSTSGCLRQ